MRGPVSAINKAFSLELRDYQYAFGKYRSHDGPVYVPAKLADFIRAVVGLTNRKIRAQHYSTARRQNPSDPANTKLQTPQRIAALYKFPPGDGVGQTIGIYEMATSYGPAGYTMRDLKKTIQSFGKNLKVPTLIDVSIDGVGNSGVSEGETGLDITVASAVAQAAKIAVYFTGDEAQSIIRAIQRMVHPNSGDPEPTILSISYGWGPDDGSADNFSEEQYVQLGELFRDAANLSITVLVSTGDFGAFVHSKNSSTGKLSSYRAMGNRLWWNYRG